MLQYVQVVTLTLVVVLCVAIWTCTATVIIYWCVVRTKSYNFMSEYYCDEFYGCKIP